MLISKFSENFVKLCINKVHACEVVLLQLTESWQMAPKPGYMLWSGVDSAVIHTSGPGQLVVMLN